MKTNVMTVEVEWIGFDSKEGKKQYWKYHCFEAMIVHKYDVYDEINADQISAGFPADFDMN